MADANKVYDSSGEITPTKAPATDHALVWDPVGKQLKSVSPEQVGYFRDNGYKTGSEAQSEALNNSTMAKVGSAATTISNIFSMGGLNAGLAATGHKGLLRQEEAAAAANPKTNIAANVVGYGASAMLGPLRVGAIPNAAVQTTRLLGGAVAGAVARTAQVAAQGLPAIAAQAAADDYTRHKVMNDPVTVDSLASSVFTDVAWNAAANLVGHGVLKTPAILRSGGEKTMEALDKYVLTKNMVKNPNPVAQGPHVSRMTFGGEEGFKNTASAEAAESGEHVAEMRNRQQTDDFYQSKIKSTESGSSEDATRTKTSEKKTTSKPGPTVAPAPEASAAPEAGAASPGGKPTFDENGLAVPHPDDMELGFNFPEENTPQQNKNILRKMYVKVLSHDPEMLGKWHKATMIEQMMQDIHNGPEAATRNAEFHALKDQKNVLKNELHEKVPRRIGPDGTVIPGFTDVNNEYARQSGNPFIDGKDASFGVQAPKGKGPAMPKTKAPGASRTSETFSTSEDVANKYKTAHSSASEDTASTRTKTDQSTYEKQKEAFAEKVRATAERTGKKKWSATISFPKPPPEMVQQGYKYKFSGDTIGKVAVGSKLLGVPGIGEVVAGGMGIHNLLTATANHAEMIGKAWDAVAIPVAKFTSPVVTATTRGVHQHKKDVDVQKPYDIKQYQAAVDAVGKLALDPNEAQSYLQKTYPALAKEHPELLARIAASVTKVAKVLNTAAPKKPYDPTLINTPFTPTRASQVQWMQTWNMLANPHNIVKSGTVKSAQAVAQALPDLHGKIQEHVQHHVTHLKGPIMGRTAGQVSMVLGAPVRPVDAADALKRTQQTAGPEPAKPPQGGGGGGKSSKISQQATQRDSTEGDIDTMGG